MGKVILGFPSGMKPNLDKFQVLGVWKLKFAMDEYTVVVLDTEDEICKECFFEEISSCLKERLTKLLKRNVENDLILWVKPKISPEELELCLEGINPSNV